MYVVRRQLQTESCCYCILTTEIYTTERESMQQGNVQLFTTTQIIIINIGKQSWMVGPVAIYERASSGTGVMSGAHTV